MRHLTQVQRTILRFLSNWPKPGGATRNDMCMAFDDTPGPTRRVRYGKALGTPGGKKGITSDSLEGMGLVRRLNSTQPYLYEITESGMTAVSMG